MFLYPSILLSKLFIPVCAAGSGCQFIMMITAVKCACIQMSLICVCVPVRGLWILPSLRAPLQARVCLRRHLHVFQLFNLKSIVLLVFLVLLAWWEHEESWDLFKSFSFSRILLSLSFLPLILLFCLFISFYSLSHCLIIMFSASFSLFSFLSFLSLSTFSVSLLRTCYLILPGNTIITQNRERVFTSEMNWIPWQEVRLCMEVSVYVCMHYKYCFSGEFQFSL